MGSTSRYNSPDSEINAQLQSETSPSQDWTITERNCCVATLRHDENAWLNCRESNGNVYMFEGHRTDEGAKFDVGGSCEGTPDFMAVEVLAGDYLFRPRDSEPDLHPDAWHHDASMLTENADTSGSVLAPKFTQNEAHDIESLWWISIIYILFFNYDKGAPNDQTPDQAKTSKKMRATWMSRIFGNTDKTMRRMFFEIQAHYVEGMKWLPQSFKFTMGFLDNLRRALVSAYTRYEKDIPTVHPEAFTSLYQHADLAFTSLITSSEGITISPYKTSGTRLKQAAMQQVVSVPGGPGKRRILKHMPGQKIDCRDLDAPLDRTSFSNSFCRAP